MKCISHFNHFSNGFIVKAFSLKSLAGYTGIMSWFSCLLCFSKHRRCTEVDVVKGYVHLLSTVYGLSTSFQIVVFLPALLSTDSSSL